MAAKAVSPARRKKSDKKRKGNIVTVPVAFDSNQLKVFDFAKDAKGISGEVLEEILKNTSLAEIERWFGELTNKRIRLDSFASTAELQKPIQEFLLAWNKNPNPRVWTTAVEAFLAKLSRRQQTLQPRSRRVTSPRKQKTRK